jgi:hypothetical protein
MSPASTLKRHPWLRAARREYETGAATRADIGARHGRASSMMSTYARLLGWNKRRAALSRGDQRINAHIDGLFGLCDTCKEMRPAGNFKPHRPGRPALRTTCHRCNRARYRRKHGAPTRAELSLLSVERAVVRASAKADRESARNAARHIRRICVSMLLACEPWAVNDRASAVEYRARYRFDPEYRAKEIARRHLRDYAFTESDGTLTPEYVQRLFAEALNCPYCGTRMPPRVKTLDHIIPRSKGGTHGAANVCVCCLSCNSRKGASTLPALSPPYDAERQGPSPSFSARVRANVDLALETGISKGASVS